MRRSIFGNILEDKNHQFQQTMSSIGQHSNDSSPRKTIIQREKQMEDYSATRKTTRAKRLGQMAHSTLRIAWAGVPAGFLRGGMELLLLLLSRGRRL